MLFDSRIIVLFLFIPHMEGKCFICWWELKKAHSGKDYMHHSSEKVYHFVKCQNCWTEMIHPMPDKKEIMSRYPSSYSAYHAVEGRKTLKERMMNALKNLQSVGRKFWLPKEKWAWRYFLDVGCGDWPSLGIMEKRWWNAFGFDIGEKSRKWNIFYWPNISDVDFWWLQFDVIYLSHAMEHMEDPEWSLKKIHDLLKKWGKVILTTPNIDCRSSRYLGPYALERDIPRHVIVHTMESATLLFKKCWFTVLESKYLTQWLIYDWYVRRNKDLWRKSYSIMKIWFLIHRIFGKLIWKTNQMWFILTK